MDRQRVIRKLISIEKRTAQILGLFVAGSLCFGSWPISLGVLLGGGVALLNFRWLWRIGEKVLFEQQWFQGMQVVLKFFTLVFVIFLILFYGRVNPIAFVTGISTLLFAILFEVIREGWGVAKKGNS